MAKVLLCTPMALGLCRAEFAVSLLGTVMHLTNSGHQVQTMIDESGSIVRSRNLAAAAVLLDNSYTHLAFADADMSWNEMDVFTRMVELDRGVIAGIYTTKWKEPRWNFKTFCDDLSQLVPDEDGLIELRAAPTGLMMIKREVLEVIAEQRPDLKINFNVIVHQPGGDVHEPGQFLFFDSRRSATGGEYMTDDYGFSETWTSLGGKLWAYPDVTIKHHFTTAHEANLQVGLKLLGVRGLVERELVRG